MADNLMDLVKMLTMPKDELEQQRQHQETVRKRLSDAGYTDDDLCKLHAAIAINTYARAIGELIAVLAHLGEHHGSVSSIQTAVMLNEQQCIAEKVMMRGQEAAQDDLGMFRPDITKSEECTAELDTMFREVLRKNKGDNPNVVH